jgi:hypothetical protein
LVVLALSLVGSVLLALAAGSVGISPGSALRLVTWKLGLADRPRGVPASTEVILFQLRMPRVALAMIVGLALAVAGTLFQGLFRNPLADPAIVGVSSGAALGAIAVIARAGRLGGLVSGGLLRMPRLLVYASLAWPTVKWRAAACRDAPPHSAVLVVVAGGRSASLVCLGAGDPSGRAHPGRGGGGAVAGPEPGLAGEERAAQLAWTSIFWRASVAGALLAGACLGRAIGFVGSRPHDGRSWPTPAAAPRSCFRAAFLVLTTRVPVRRTGELRSR